MFKIEIYGKEKREKREEGFLSGGPAEKVVGAVRFRTAGVRLLHGAGGIRFRILAGSHQK